MMRFFLSIGVLLTAIVASFSAFLDRTGVTDWVERLESPETFATMATQTTPMPLWSTSTQPTASVVVVEIDTATQTPSGLATKTPPKVSLPPPALKPVAIPPPPPDTTTPSPRGDINEKAILELTNVERVRDGQSILTWNEKLASMAYQKAIDMLDRQYFAHESPDGKNVAGLAEDAGYLYRLVGENLAVGNFRTNEQLIAGWMGSPGHRENMLKSEYTEMGAAAVEGVYEGDRVWMAVQEFGKPFPLCTKPDLEKKVEIETSSETLASLDESIGIARRAIDTSVDDATRAQKVVDYNALVDLYNTLVVSTRALVNEYNDSVRFYNDCIEG